MGRPQVHRGRRHLDALVLCVLVVPMPHACSGHGHSAEARPKRGASRAARSLPSGVAPGPLRGSPARNRRPDLDWNRSRTRAPPHDAPAVGEGRSLLLRVIRSLAPGVAPGPPRCSPAWQPPPRPGFEPLPHPCPPAVRPGRVECCGSACRTSLKTPTARADPKSQRFAFVSIEKTPTPLLGTQKSKRQTFLPGMPNWTPSKIKSRPVFR
mmetsp:Transcript_33290/g.81742  ORF Transcript_33290/g.81742 Transcript_33290/m.81742 type:complete len:210 (-) Transcript_33290:446-1075(-)